jgi:hypothetical protein
MVRMRQKPLGHLPCRTKIDFSTNAAHHRGFLPCSRHSRLPEENASAIRERGVMLSGGCADIAWFIADSARWAALMKDGKQQRW